MFGRNPESRDFVVGLILTILVVAGLFAYSHWMAPSALPASTVHRVPEDRTERGSSGPSRSSQVIATVYECNGTSGRVLSDRPCAQDARIREVLAPNRMPIGRDGANQTTVQSASHATARRSSSDVATVSRIDKVCASIEAEIDAINARMRHKYSNAEGEYYRQRLRELSDQRWNANCR